MDDDYFWRFDVTGVTTRPKVGDVYRVAANTKAEILEITKTSSTAGTISFRTTENQGSLTTALNNLVKISGNGDATLSTGGNYDNMILVKTITNDTQAYGSDLIFGKDFVNNYIPFWHKIQLVIELVKTTAVDNNRRSPEIYELSMISDITDVTL